MRKKVIQYSSLFLGTIVFIAVLRYMGADDIILSLRFKSPISFLYYLIISFTIFSGFVIRWYLITRSHGHHVSLINLFNYRVAGFAVSYMTPSARLGGEPVRTYFLIKEGIPVEKAMSSVFIDRSLEMTANIIMTLIGAVFFIFIVNASWGMLWLMLLLTIASIIMLWIFYMRIVKGKGLLTSFIRYFDLQRYDFIRKMYYNFRESEIEMSKFFNYYRRVFIVSTIISFILWVLTIFEYRFLLAAFGYSASFTEAYFVIIVVGIAYLVPIPTAIGFLEGAQVALFSFLKKPVHYGLTVSFITRIRDMMWTLYGLGFLYFKGIVVNNLLKDKEHKVEVNDKVRYFKKWRI